MYYSTYLLRFLKILRMSFHHPVRIVVRSESAIMSIDGTIQLKNCFIRENYIEKKVGVIVSFFYIHEFVKFHTTIKTIFVQLLYQINFIQMKLDFFKILCTAINVMLLICFARAEVEIFYDCATSSHFSSSRRYWSSWNLAIFHATRFMKRLIVRSTMDFEMCFHREKFC